MTTARFQTPSSLVKNLYQRAWQANIPLNATIELSLKCNLSCVHCYNFDRNNFKSAKSFASKILSLPSIRIIELIDELTQAGTLFLAFTGGEALLHPHIFAYIEKAKKSHLFVRIKSNGTTLKEAVCQKLKNLKVNEIEVSLYGATEQTHDNFTQRKGSFLQTIKGLEQAKKWGLNIRTSIIVHNQNYQELESMIRLSERLTQDYQISLELTKRHDGTSSSQDFRLNPHQMHELLYGSSRHRFIRGPSSGTSVQCSCAKINVGISANGDVYPCIGAPLPSGNLKNAHFREIWINSPQLQKIRNLTLVDFKSCTNCSDRFYCSRSSGSVYVNTGEYTGPEPWVCAQANMVKDISSTQLNKGEHPAPAASLEPK